MTSLAAYHIEQQSDKSGLPTADVGISIRTASGKGKKQ